MRACPVAQQYGAFADRRALLGNRRIQRESVSRHREWFRHTRRGRRRGELERQDLAPSVWADGNTVLD